MKKISYLLVFCFILFSCSDSLEQDEPYKEIRGIQEYAVFENSIPTDMKFANQNTGYISDSYDSKAGVAKIAKTTDGGNTWEKVNDTGTNGLSFVNDKTAYAHQGSVSSGVAGGFFYRGQIIKTIDGGKSWREIFSFNDYITDLVFTDEKTGYIFTFKNNVYKTTDSGENWQLIKNLDEIGASYYSVAKPRPNEPIYFATGNSVFRTIDDFQTVEKIYESNQGNNQSVTIIKAERTADDTIYFLTSQQNIIQIKLQ